MNIVLNNTLPVHVDGEAWSQTPVKINISQLQNQTYMLVRSSQEHFARGLTQGQAKSLVNKQPIIGQEATAQFSSRRPRELNSQSSQPVIGTSTHTLYIKDKVQEDDKEE